MIYTYFDAALAVSLVTAYFSFLNPVTASNGRQSPSTGIDHRQAAWPKLVTVRTDEKYAITIIYSLNYNTG